MITYSNPRRRRDFVLVESIQQSEGICFMHGKTIIIKKAEPYDGPIRVVVTVCPSCGRRLMKGMTKCPEYLGQKCRIYSRAKTCAGCQLPPD